MSIKRVVIAICGIAAIVFSMWLTAATGTAWDSPVSPMDEPRAAQYEQNYLLLPMVLGGE